MSGQRWMQLLLLATAGVVLVQAVDVASNPIASVPQADSLRTPSPADATESTLTVPTLAALDALGATRERPLFSPTRRPASTNAVAAVAQAAQPAAVEFFGTMSGPGGARALLRAREVANPIWLSVGASVAGWRVVEIEKDSVLLQADGKSLELTLYPAKVAQ